MCWLIYGNIIVFYVHVKEYEYFFASLVIGRKTSCLHDEQNIVYLRDGCRKKYLIKR